jgi:peptide/nickel transport system permease protein
MLGLVLLWVLPSRRTGSRFSARTRPGTIPGLVRSEFIKDVGMHMVLPVLSIVLSALGFWALGMRAMMVSVQNDDYVQFAEAKGSKGDGLLPLRRTNALPQVTALGLTIGYITLWRTARGNRLQLSGIGNVLYRSIKAYDYFAIEGIVFGVIVSITLWRYSTCSIRVVRGSTMRTSS